jgi:hypothetical protein
MLPQRDDVRTRIEKVAMEIFGWWEQENEVFSIPSFDLLEIKKADPYGVGNALCR